MALQRVEDGVARQKRFTANSAHELRTPITILRNQVSGMDESPLKRDLQRTARRIQTILEQLLVLAQVTDRAGGALPSSISARPSSTLSPIISPSRWKAIGVCASKDPAPPFSFRDMVGRSKAS